MGGAKTFFRFEAMGATRILFGGGREARTFSYKLMFKPFNTFY
jgi:hypothetical protein